MNITAKIIATKAGEIAAIAVVLGFIGTLWINGAVEERMKELVPEASQDPVVVANQTDIENLEAGQKRIENKVDAFSSEFLAYLARQSQ